MNVGRYENLYILQSFHVCAVTLRFIRITKTRASCMVMRSTGFLKIVLPFEKG